MADKVLRALVGFEHWQSINKALPLWLVKYHLASIGGVEASRMEVVLDEISPHRGFGATSWPFPALNVSFEVIHPSYKEGGWHEPL